MKMKWHDENGHTMKLPTFTKFFLCEVVRTKNLLNEILFTVFFITLVNWILLLL